MRTFFISVPKAEIIRIYNGVKLTFSMYIPSTKDTLTSAKLARSLGTIVDLLLQCNELGTIAERAGVVDRCIHGIVDCWLMSAKLRHRTSSSKVINISIN